MGTRRTPATVCVLGAVAPAVTLGVGLMWADCSSRRAPLLNVVAATSALAISRFAGPHLARLVRERPAGTTASLLALVALSLASPGIQGVHRWLGGGLVRLQPSAILLPLVLLGLAALVRSGRLRTAGIATAAAFALLAGQPDAGQATALAAGLVTSALAARIDGTSRVALTATALVGASVAWQRPDPLAPVHLVEDIVPMAFAQHWALGVAATFTLALPALCALAYATRSAQAGRSVGDDDRSLGLALAAYLATSGAAPAFGAFPTPLLGFGASPILGTVVGLGALLSVGKSSEPTPS